MRIRLSVVAALVVLAVGCGESIEHKLEQAKISLNSGRPDAALTFAEAVLAQRPGDPTAMLLMAKAHLRLRHFGDSRQMLKKLIAIDSNNPDNHRELLNLVLAEMTDLLATSEFNTNATLAERFTAAKEEGHEQADWLVTVGKEVAAGEFARARLLILDSQRIDKLVREEEIRIRGEAGARDANAPVTSPAIEEQRRQVKGLLLTAEKHLENALASEPTHFNAAGNLVWLLRGREGWNELWVLAGKLQVREDLPSALASELVATILNIPDRLYPEPARLEVCRKLLGAVSAQGRSSPQWKVVRARLHLRDREKDKAMELAQEAFRAQPTDVEARLTYAWCLYETAQYPLAKTILESLATERRDHEHVQLLYGLTLVQTGDRTLAAEALRRATDINPSNQIARTALVTILGGNRDSISVVLEDINKLYLANAGDPDAIRFKFMAEVATDSRANVKTLLEAVEKISPRKSGHLRVLVDGFIYLNDTNQALKYATEWTTLQGDQVEPYMAVARVHLIRNQLDQARRLLVELSEKFPGSGAVNETLTQLYLNQGFFDKAIELATALIKEKPENVNARLMLAMALSQLSLTEEALDQTKEILNRTPDDPRALELAASIYRMAGQPDLALAYLEKIDESKIEESQHPGVLAQLKLQKGDVSEATAICNRAIAAGSTDPRIRLTLASIHSRAKNPGEEEIHLIAFVREHPSNFLGYQMLSRFYLMNNIERGLNQLRSLRAGNDSLARLAEGSLLASGGRHGEAIEVLAGTYVQLLKNRDRTAWSYARVLAACYIRRDRNVTNAVAVFDGLIAARLNAPAAMLTQLDIQWNGLSGEARLQFIQRVESMLTTDDMEAILATSSRYAKAGRPDLTLALLDQWLVKMPKRLELYRARGEMLAQMGRHQDAVQTFQKALELDPETSGNYERLASALIRSGDFPAAEMVFDKMSTLDLGAKISAVWGKGNLYLQIGLNEQAVQAFMELDSIGRRGDPRVLLVMGRGLMALGRQEEARKMLLLVPSHSTHYAVAQVLLARLEMAAGLLDAAKTRLGLLAQDQEAAAAAVRELVELNMMQGNDAQLMEWSDAVLKLDELPIARRSQWLMIRSALQSKKQDWVGLEKTLEQAHGVSQNPSSVKAARIALLVHLKKTEQAQSLYREDKTLRESSGGAMLALVMGMPPENGAPLSSLAKVLQAVTSKNIGAAKQAAMAMQPYNVTTFPADYVNWLSQTDQSVAVLEKQAKDLVLAVIARDAGVPALSVEICRQLVKEFPALVPAHSLLIQSLEDQQSSVDSAYSAALVAAPDSSLSFYVQSIQKGKKGDWQGAIDACKAILKREGQHEWVHYHLASLHRQAGQFDASIDALEALSAYAKLVRSRVINDLAYRLATHRPARLNDALTLAKAIVAEFPKVSAYADTLAWIEHLLGNDAVALQRLASVLPSLSAVPEIHHHIGVLYQKQGNKKWAGYHLAVAAKEGVADVKHDSQKRLDELSAK